MNDFPLLPTTAITVSLGLGLGLDFRLAGTSGQRRAGKTLSESEVEE